MPGFANNRLVVSKISHSNRSFANYLHELGIKDDAFGERLDKKRMAISPPPATR